MAHKPIETPEQLIDELTYISNEVFKVNNRAYDDEFEDFTDRLERVEALLDDLIAALEYDNLTKKIWWKRR